MMRITRTFTNVKESLYYWADDFMPNQHESIVQQVVEYFCIRGKSDWLMDFTEKETFFIIRLHCKESYSVSRENITIGDMRAAHKDIIAEFDNYNFNDRQFWGN